MMTKARNVHILLALAALGLVPACSNMGGRSSGASTAASPAAQPVANDMVRQVQARLQQDGYYKQGSVDGVWGTGTMNAVQAFQRDHNLSASGKLDVPTLQAMNIANTGNYPSNYPTTPTVDPTATPGNTTTDASGATAPAYTGRPYTAPNSTLPPNRQP